jgi:hypothetical protein
MTVICLDCYRSMELMGVGPAMRVISGDKVYHAAHYHCTCGQESYVLHDQLPQYPGPEPVGYEPVGSI